MTGGRAQIGIGFRPELSHGLFADRSSVDVLEVVAETLLARDAWRREAIALSRTWPTFVHGVKLSLASADGIDVDHARKVGALARELSAPFVTEHVALTRTRRRDIGHLTAVPFTREALGVVARNVAIARRHLPDVPFLLENPAWTLRWPDDAMSEGDFYHEVVERTGCGMLLDVANVYANARNAGVDPRAFLRSHPLHAVRMIHVAGGVFEHGFYFDTHAHAVPREVFELCAEAIAACGEVPIVLERDGNYPPFAELATELATLRSVVAEHARASEPWRTTPKEHDSEPALDLARRQEELACALVGNAPCGAFDPRGVARTRAVLCEKRIDDAIPLLGRLARRRTELEPIVRDVVATWPRPNDLVGPRDAMRIADLAAAHGDLADDARFDRLLLRARFAIAGDAIARRVGPFVGSERVRDKTVWAWKAPGESGSVHLYARGGLP